jgi:hypothetical protein
MLLEKHGIRTIDLLHLDTEGYDYEIIKQVNFRTFNPRIILYETVHLTDADRARCSEYLMSQGYNLINSYVDTLAHLD